MGDISLSLDALDAQSNAKLATLTLNNAGKLNAMDSGMWQQLRQHVHTLNDNDDIRCVILRGTGEAFCAGGDILEFIEQRDTLERARRYHEQWVATALHAVRDCKHPTVAQIQGACVGGGLELACACDIRIASRDARFGAPINKLGFSMAPAELEVVLAVTGPALAREILLEGRMLSAADALQRGLLSRVVEREALEDEVSACARRIAHGAPLVARAHKQLIARLVRSTTLGTPLSEAELVQSYAWLDTEDYREGLDAFANKRAPKFRGR